MKFNLDICNSKRLTEKIFIRLRKLEKQSKEKYQYWFKIDPTSTNETFFENICNNHKICIYTNNLITANILYTFLNMIANDSPLEWYLNNITKTKLQYTLKEIINIMQPTNNSLTCSTVLYDDIDQWDLLKIYLYFQVHYLD